MLGKTNYSDKMSREDEASVLGKSKRVNIAQRNAQELMIANHVPSFQYPK